MMEHDIVTGNIGSIVAYKGHFSIDLQDVDIGVNQNQIIESIINLFGLTATALTFNEAFAGVDAY